MKTKYYEPKLGELLIDGVIQLYRARELKLNARQPGMHCGWCPFELLCWEELVNPEDSVVVRETLFRLDNLDNLR